MSFGRRTVPLDGSWSVLLSHRRGNVSVNIRSLDMCLGSTAVHGMIPVSESDSRLAYCFRRPLVAEIGIQSPPAGARLAATGNGHEPEFRREDWASW
jgi:hypothetical protein